MNQIRMYANAWPFSTGSLRTMVSTHVNTQSSGLYVRRTFSGPLLFACRCAGMIFFDATAIDQNLSRCCYLELANMCMVDSALQHPPINSGPCGYCHVGVLVPGH